MAIARALFFVVVVGLMIAYLELGVKQDLTKQDKSHAVWMSMMKMSPAFLMGTWSLFGGVFSPAFAASKPAKGTTRAAGWYSLLVGFGLILGAIGDASLEMEKVDKRAFLIGLVSFLIGHLMYIVAFFVTGVDMPMGKVLFSTSVFGSVAGLLLYILIPSVQGKDDGKLVVPVIIYAATLAAMAIVASLWKGEGTVVPSADSKPSAKASTTSIPPSEYSGVATSRAWNCAFAGAVIFLISDSILAIDKFHQPFSQARAATMVTYFLAQTLFELSAFFLRSADERAAKIAKTK